MPRLHRSTASTSHSTTSGSKSIGGKAGTRLKVKRHDNVDLHKEMVQHEAAKAKRALSATNSYGGVLDLTTMTPAEVAESVENLEPLHPRVQTTYVTSGELTLNTYDDILKMRSGLQHNEHGTPRVGPTGRVLSVTCGDRDFRPDRVRR